MDDEGVNQLYDRWVAAIDAARTLQELKNVPWAPAFESGPAREELARSPRFEAAYNSRRDALLREQAAKQFDEWVAKQTAPGWYWRR